MSTARAAGLLLLLTAIATAVSVMTRLNSSVEPLEGSLISNFPPFWTPASTPSPARPAFYPAWPCWLRRCTCGKR